MIRFESPANLNLNSTPPFSPARAPRVLNRPMSSDLVFSLPQLQEERQRLKRKQATELFAPLHSQPFTRVEISGCSVPDEAATVAAKGLQSLARKKCLRELVLSDCIAGLPTEEALKSLTTLCEAVGSWKGLRSVDFSSNALGSRGVAACASVLKDQPLEEVFFSNNGLAAPSIKLIRKWLCGDGKATRLRTFHCTLNCIQSDGFVELVEIVKLSPKLEEIKFSSLRAESDATLELCRALQSFDSLRVFDLSDNALNEEGASVLGGVLKGQTRLEVLMLRDLGLADDELGEILNPLIETKPPLQVLDLSGNEISAEGSQLVVDILHNFADSLQTLLLADNEMYDSGTLRIASALGDMDESALQSLSLSANMVRDFAAITIAENAIMLPFFSKLDIDENYLSEKAVSGIQTFLGDALGPMDKMVPEDERDEVDENEPEVNEEDVVAALERLALRAEPGNTEISPRVSDLITQFDSSSAGATPGDPPFSEVSTSVDPSFETPQPRRRGSRPMSTQSDRDQVFSSAKKLNKDLQDIKQSLSGFVTELNEISETSPRELSLADSQSSLLANLDEEDKERNTNSFFFDVFGGLLMSVFVVILVLSIAASQEENSFSYRPV